MAEDALTRELALAALNDHLGEYVVVRFAVTSAGDGWPVGTFPVIELHGELGHPQDALQPPLDEGTRDVFAAVYKVGDQSVCLAPLPGTISAAANGLDFALADGLTLSIKWRDPDDEGGDE